MKRPHKPKPMKSAAQRSRSDAGKQGWQPSPATPIVHEALRVANLAFTRVVTVDEVVAALRPAERKQLSEWSSLTVRPYVKQLLQTLTLRDVVFSPGIRAGYRYYGSPDILDRSSPLPPVKTGQERVLDVVVLLVARLRRAVRSGEVVSALGGTSGPADDPKGTQRTLDGGAAITAAKVWRYIAELVKSGKLQRIEDARFSYINGGQRLYLPAGLSAEEYQPKEPLAWIDAVVLACEAIWAERLAEADAEGRRPRPFGTGDVRAYLMTQSPHHPEMSETGLLPKALQQLAKRKTDAFLHRIGGEDARLLRWAPRRVPLSDLDLDSSYASDTERLEEAVRRAIRRAGVPAVGQAQVVAEIERDSALVLLSGGSVSCRLTELAKTAYTDSNGWRRRARQVVYRVGRPGNRPLYATDMAEATLAYARSLDVLDRWRRLDVSARLDACAAARLPSVAVGRALVLEADVGVIIADATACSRPELAAAAELLRNVLPEVRNAAQRVTRRLQLLDSVRRGLPSAPVSPVPVLTFRDFGPLAAPLWERAKVVDRSALSRVIPRAILRVPNPEFVGYRDVDVARRPRLALDRTSALLHLAEAWGGPHARSCAANVRTEIDRLRDPRFVAPALNATRADDRLLGVSCLAFLPTPESQSLLRTAALQDDAPGVRRTALWGYAVSGGEGAADLLAQRADADPSPLVRSFVREAVARAAHAAGGWWHV